MKKTTANSDLRKSGLKVTLPRLSILEILEEAEQHLMSAEDVYRTLLGNRLQKIAAELGYIVNDYKIVLDGASKEPDSHQRRLAMHNSTLTS